MITSRGFCMKGPRIRIDPVRGKGILRVLVDGEEVMELSVMLERGDKRLAHPELKLGDAETKEDRFSIRVEAGGLSFKAVLEFVADFVFYAYLDEMPGTPEGQEDVGILGINALDLDRALVYHLGRHPPDYFLGFGYYTEKAAGREPRSAPPSDLPAYPPEELEQEGELGQDPFSFPVVTGDLGTLPFEAPIVFAILRGVSGRVIGLLPLSDGGCKSLLRVENGLMEFRSRSFLPGFETERIPLGVVSMGSDPYEVVEGAAVSAKKVAGHCLRLRREKRYPEPFKYLGWCSWNAYLHDITQDKIANSVEDLVKAGVPVRFVIIDDGWLSVRERRLISFLPDAEKFPSGFRPLVEKLRDLGVRWVGVWHTLQGYWGGLDAGSFRDYAGSIFEGGDGRCMPSPIDLRAYKFYHDWYQELSRQGISFVKVDNQNDQPRYFAGKVPMAEASRNIHHALQGAAYGSDLEILNCMCMTPGNYLNWVVSNVARASSDYIPSWKAGAKFHLMFCVYNSLWYSQFAWPDYDMFMSYDPYAWQHAVFRAISGGPIYITDGPRERPNLDLIRKLAFTDGRVPRPDMPALPDREILFEDVYNGSKPLKAWTMVHVDGFGLSLIHI